MKKLYMTYPDIGVSNVRLTWRSWGFFNELTHKTSHDMSDIIDLFNIRSHWLSFLVRTASNFISCLMKIGTTTYFLKQWCEINQRSWLSIRCRLKKLAARVNRFDPQSCERITRGMYPVDYETRERLAPILIILRYSNGSQPNLFPCCVPLIII